MIICGTYQRYGLDNETKMQIIKFTQYFTPVLVLTWLLSSFTKYVDQTGNEIFFFRFLDIIVGNQQVYKNSYRDMYC